MCGEHLVCLKAALSTVGSSPHVRGAHPRKPTGRADRGIIPACAGSTPTPRSRRKACRDHPRMCGEHQKFDTTQIARLGSSPHVRGAHQHDRVRAHDGGIIPACAGSTKTSQAATTSTRDHPRMCGEHAAGTPTPRPSLGSSPHVRGARGKARDGIHVLGIIPACAGSTHNICILTSSYWDHPRMRGEHASMHACVQGIPGSSPHVRGAPTACRIRSALVGIIPACAGSTRPLAWRAVPSGDHPRMCGEHYKHRGSITPNPGSSPHVRGALQP